MSAEEFETVLSCDVRSTPDGAGLEYGPAGENQPRFTSTDRGPEAWATCAMYAEDVLRIAADTIAATPMTGLTGDHPDKREQISSIIQTCADLVRALALDSACDAELRTDAWDRGILMLGTVGRMDDDDA